MNDVKNAAKEFRMNWIYGNVHEEVDDTALDDAFEAGARWHAFLTDDYTGLNDE